MTEEQIALAKRAVACKGWRWMPGMLTTCDLRVVDGGDDYAIGHRSGPTKDGGGWYDGEAAGLLPDLTDPATMGCVLALVREAWSAPRALVRLSANGKSFHVFDVDRVTMGGNWAAFLCGDRGLQTEADALVAALEARNG